MRTLAAVVATTCVAAGASLTLGQEAQPSPTDDRVTVVQGRVIEGFQVEVTCSETQLRTPIATVTWRLRPGREEADGMRVDVAANKQGFAKGQFVKLFLGPAPRLEPSAGLAREADGTLGKTLSLEVEGGGRELAGDRARVRVRNLEPGVLYFWRPAERAGREWAGARAVRVEAPVCVADIVEEKP
jgi:hypothetical protein